MMINLEECGGKNIGIKWILNNVKENKDNAEEDGEIGILE